MMATAIKICGLKTSEAIAAAADAVASHIGLVHYKPSPRHVSLAEAAALRRAVPPGVKAVLLLVNADPQLTQDAINQVRPDVVQFHGTETPEWLATVRRIARVEVWKALGIRDAAALARAGRYRDAADRLLFDAPAAAMPGGTGTRFDWSILNGHSHELPWGLAGGLSPDNVADALAATGAPLVDASSGLESAPGVKDVDKIRAFAYAVRRHEHA